MEAAELPHFKYPAQNHGYVFPRDISEWLPWLRCRLIAHTPYRAHDRRGLPCWRYPYLERLMCSVWAIYEVQRYHPQAG